MPYRISATPDPEPLELEDPYAAVLRAQRRRARIASALVVVFGAAGLARAAQSGQHPPPHSPVTEASRLGGARIAIAGARARAASAQVGFEHGVRKAIGEGVGPRPDLGACPVTLPEVSSLTPGRASFPLLTIDRADLTENLPSQAIAAVLADVQRAEGHLAAGRFEEATLYARALGQPERFSYDVVLVARINKKVKATSGTTYEPGEIEGRAYVFDFASGRVVCAADVKAKSSKEIGYVYSDRSDTPASIGPLASMADAIREDLRVQTERALIEALRFRAGP